MSPYTTLPRRPASGDLSPLEPDDRPLPIDRAELQRQILEALADGPKGKWDLHVQLHHEEYVVYRELQVLRVNGQVKVVSRLGHRRVARKWALMNWLEDPTPAPGTSPKVLDDATAIRTPRSTSTESWWTKPLTREEFQQRAQRGAETS